jgi:hypothetical protein
MAADTNATTAARKISHESGRCGIGSEHFAANEKYGASHWMLGRESRVRDLAAASEVFEKLLHATAMSTDGRSAV